MKSILSLILVSALVLSATANIQAASRILVGFTYGLDYKDLTPSILNCSISIEKTHLAAFEVDKASTSMEPEVFEQAVANLGYNFAHSIRICGVAKQTAANLVDAIIGDIKNLTQADLTNRLFLNLFQFNTMWAQIKTYYANQEFEAVGGVLADMFKLMVYGKTNTKRQLGQFEAIKEKMVVDFNATILGVLGFIEEANTTIVVDHYNAFVNDTTFLISLIPVLEKAIESFDFQTIVATVTNISKYATFVGADANLLKQEAVAFYQRDFPLFSDETKLTKALESLFLDLPTTFTNVQRITNALKINDYREAGHGTGAIYNQLRNGAMKP